MKLIILLLVLASANLISLWLYQKVGLSERWFALINTVANALGLYWGITFFGTPYGHPVAFAAVGAGAAMGLYGAWIIVQLTRQDKMRKDKRSESTQD